MAISVNNVYERVSVLAKKSQNGYSSGADFNSDLRDCNLTLYEFYYKIFEEEQRIADALLPFIKEVSLPLTKNLYSATTPFPSDYQHRLEIGVNKVLNAENDCGGQGCKKKKCVSCNTPLPTQVYQVFPKTPLTPPSIKQYPCDYMTTDEEMWTLSSAIRKPSIKKNIYRHTFKNNLIHVYPKEVNSIWFKYLRKSATPYWDSTLVSTANGDYEQFIPVGPGSLSVDFEFPEQEFSNIVDIMLFYLGVEVRESVLINFVKAKQTQPLVQ